jgi:outer membrane protein W
MMAMTGVAMAGTEGGDKEIQVQGSFSSMTNSVNDDETYTSTVQLAFNYFFTSNISIGGTWRGQSSVTEPENGDSSTTTNNFLLLRGDFYLGSATSQIMPYIGAQIGQVNYTYESGGDEDSDSMGTYGFHGGLKIFAGENTSWNIELDTTTYTMEQDYGDDIDINITSILFGFSYYF